MEPYGKALKKLIKFTGSKLSVVAEAVGYDESYISKWCSQSKLPSQKVSCVINRNLSKFFANEILLNDELETYRHTFDKLANRYNLDQSLYLMLKNSYNSSYSYIEQQQKKADRCQPRVLTNYNEINNFFNNELPKFIDSCNESIDIYCTIDICKFLKQSSFTLGNFNKTQKSIKLHMGLKKNSLTTFSYDQFKRLYFVMNKYSFVSFEFYNDDLMEDMNTILVKDKFAVICSMDQYSRFQTSIIIAHPDHIKEIYQNITQSYKSTNILINTTEPSEFNSKNYRTDFYAQSYYQIFLARGFEYLLPPDCMDAIQEQARDKMHDEVLASLVEKMKIIWEEMFEHGSIEFFTLKSSLMRYLEDGILIFSDVVYHMSVDERRRHIENVLISVEKNPKIHFYVIDDEYIPDASQLIHTSVYSNGKKIYFKNPQRYFSDQGPFFYSIHSEDIITKTSSFFEELKTKSFCRKYDADDVKEFLQKYGSIVYRILSLSNLK